MNEKRGGLSKVQYIRKKLDNAIVQFESQPDSRFAGKIRVVRIGNQLHVVRVDNGEAG